MELIFVSVCLWYIIDYMGALYTIENTPLGFNIENTYRIDLSERTQGSDNYISPEDKTTTTGEDLLAVMERIRQYPAIESVSLSVASQPYAATPYSQTFYKKLLYNDTGVSAQEYRVTLSFFDVFKIQSPDGKDPKTALSQHSIIISSNMAEDLTKEGNIIGKNVIVGENGQEKQITAEYIPVRWSEYFKPHRSFFSLLSEDDITHTVNSGNLSNMELCIRTKPEESPGFIDAFIKDMAPLLMVGNIYMMDVRPASYIRKGTIGPVASTIYVRSLLLGFLLVNIFLGISGVFGLRVQQRRSELGLRIALGSSKLKLQLLVIVEGLALLSLAMIPVIIIALNIGLFELVHLEWIEFTPFRFLLGILATYLIMACIIFSGVCYPAYRTSLIEPANALRNE
ncbi:putative ABC transport system permease protein [Dysgonomonas hofstadii]|uniref:Putative ABC transport system permease protein n=1 Tax=Dysgonomonas hofstadii TaxID=637886 RepID=A0A840CJS3_9BACT|nr:ABC transporter permease [Dysgonomonas hofstadii]MBB4035616.1 putative ABC transport system permease protein [Dysgonomonas hofstadii]